MNIRGGVAGPRRKPASKRRPLSFVASLCRLSTPPCEALLGHMGFSDSKIYEVSNLLIMKALVELSVPKIVVKNQIVLNSRTARKFYKFGSQAAGRLVLPAAFRAPPLVKLQRSMDSSGEESF